MGTYVDQFDAAFLLAMKYKSPVVTLEAVIADFLPHLTIETAKKRANKQNLPFPAFKSEDNTKATWLVNITDVALWLNKQRENSAKDWQNLHS
ncbi:pyocin activator PrtN family protein [Acinetobacter bereziniae]|uniref:pyocin activator PrtN family protein n=1 Tax=Acinetobacter bereziniae TaxID=106648 RepID=UPI002577B17F|nr:pyocin activator PrtN family protein [Acinetobacter bereziniae]MDM1784235.1 pyocin activator PrtN family protein [Acinetobacter bereziniae]